MFSYVTFVYLSLLYVPGDAGLCNYIIIVFIYYIAAHFIPRKKNFLGSITTRGISIML